MEVLVQWRIICEEFQILFALLVKQNQVAIMKGSLHILPFKPIIIIIKIYWKKYQILEKTHNHGKKVLRPMKEIVRKKIYSSQTFRICQKFRWKSMHKSIKEKTVWRQIISIELKMSPKSRQDEWDSYQMFRLPLLFKVSESCLELK